MGRVESIRRVTSSARDEAFRPYAQPLSPASYGHSSSGAEAYNSSPSSYDTDKPFVSYDSVSLTDNGDGTYSLEPDEFGSYPGFPSVRDYEEIQDRYLKNLSARKQDKALITQTMYDCIYSVLMDPSNTCHGTPQFRFWVRKMFLLACFQGEYTVTHDEKPVAAKEQIYQILVHCHGECYHGGRDKTCAQIKQYYSWIPKELIAQFVKKCPTCTLKRNKHAKKVVVKREEIGSYDDYLPSFTLPKVQSYGQYPSEKTQNTFRKPRPPPLVFGDSFTTSFKSRESLSPPLFTPGLLEDNTLYLHQTPSSAGPYSALSSEVATPLSASWSFGAGVPDQSSFNHGAGGGFYGGMASGQAKSLYGGAPMGRLGARGFSYYSEGPSSAATLASQPNWHSSSLSPFQVNEGPSSGFPGFSIPEENVATASESTTTTIGQLDMVPTDLGVPSSNFDSLLGDDTEEKPLFTFEAPITFEAPVTVDGGEVDEKAIIVLT